MKQMDLCEHLPEHKLDRHMQRKCGVFQQGLSTYIEDNQMVGRRVDRRLHPPYQFNARCPLVVTNLIFSVRGLKLFDPQVRP